jgi:hypothetical protein
MQDSRLVPIFVDLTDESLPQEQVNSSLPSEIPTEEFADLQLDDRRTIQGPQSPPYSENVQAAQAFLELHTSQPLPAAEGHVILQIDIFRQSESVGNPFGRGSQADDLAGRLDGLTVDPRFIFTPTSLPEPFPRRPAVISTANDTPIETLHFIEVCIFHRRQPWQTVWEELRKQNIFMPVETMTDILRQWLALVEIAMFRKQRYDENFSLDFLVILERYERLVRDGDVECLWETWQRLTAMLNDEENSE